ncbi:MAG: Morphine 6-dehydrogenase [Gammaproteobacteria bacterium]|nr:Morphine 6-dehydrogenase [Gammaproteobacteria bacterium]
MTRTTIPSFTLNNSLDIPVIGFGVFQTPPDETTAAVLAALGIGYRHIDTAAAYGNERGVGEALRRSGLARDDVFIETKVWVTDYGYDAALRAFDKSAGKLGVDVIDLLLLHQPRVEDFALTIAAYQALEKLLAEGRVRAIGVSNFTPAILARFLPEVEVVPAVNQIELHPYFTQRTSMAANTVAGILTQAWSPLGGITFYGGYKGPGKSTLTDPTLRELAAAHGKTPAQVMLRWHVQQGRQVIPKSTKPARIAENFDIFDFELGADELARIDALDTGIRGGPDPDQPQPQFLDYPIPAA